MDTAKNLYFFEVTQLERIVGTGKSISSRGAKSGRRGPRLREVEGRSPAYLYLESLRPLRGHRKYRGTRSAAACCHKGDPATLSTDYRFQSKQREGRHGCDDHRACGGSLGFKTSA